MARALCRYWLCHLAYCAALAALASSLTPTLAMAASALDSSHSAATRSSGRGLSWVHALGAGSDRVLVVGVTTEDNQSADPGVVVRFNGTPMLPVPGAVALTGDRAGRDHGFLRTQLFYLLDSSLPPGGTYAVEVSLSRTVREIGGGSTSIFGLAQAPPEAVVGAAAPQGSSTLSSLLAVATQHSWIVQAAGGDRAVPLVPSGPGLPVSYADLGRGVSVAGSAAMVADAGPAELGWTLSGAGRLTVVAAAFGPRRLPLTHSVDGRGTVTPAAGLYPDGVTVHLTAEPSAGWTFSEWSGDVTGSDNPAALVMDGPKNVVAHFVPDFGLVGWATTNGGTTGGEGGPEVVVDTLAALKHYAELNDDPYVIKIAGTIIGNGSVRVRSNKSILGIGSDARLLGVGLEIGTSATTGQIRNVIVRNITFEKSRAPLDGVAISYGAKNVWVDHCRFLSDREHGVDFYDGLLDITNAADFVTVSWCRFTEHYKTSLVGSGDGVTGDAGHLTVTYHHNSFINSGGRNPSVRFGLVHVFDNYYRDLDDYGIASRMGGEVVVENNWFENVMRPIRADTSLSPVAGRVRGTDTNVFLNCTPNSIVLPDATWVPPYDYPLDPVNDVPWIVARWAGVGVVTYEGVAPPDSPPVITVQPVSQTIEAGATITLSVLVDGSWPFTYTWLKDGIVIPGATGAELKLVNVQSSDIGSYAAVIENAVGTVTTAPATLGLYDDQNGGLPGVYLDDQFTDFLRNNQALPGSAAWVASSGTSNLTVPAGQTPPVYMRQAVSSSRTLLAYFTDSGKVLTLGDGQTLTLGFTFQFSGFDAPARLTDMTFYIGLLRSVPNPGGRVTADNGGNAQLAFTNYTGFAAFTNTRAVSADEPIKFYARTKPSATLLGSTGAFDELPAGSPTASVAMAINAPYRGTLRLERSGNTVTVSYTAVRVSDDAVMMQHSSSYDGPPMNAFDTVAFYLSRNAPASYNFLVTKVTVERSY